MFSLIHAQLCISRDEDRIPPWEEVASNGTCSSPSHNRDVLMLSQHRPIAQGRLTRQALHGCPTITFKQFGFEAVPRQCFMPRIPSTW